MQPQVYVFEQGTSHKFWSARVEGNELVTHWGRVGTAGQEKAKDCGSEAAAHAAADKAIAEKLRKGYVADDATASAFNGAPTRRREPEPEAAALGEQASEPDAPQPAVADDRAPIELGPLEEALCPWRPLPEPPSAEPRPFDPDRALAAIRKVQNNYGWWHWPSSPIELPLSREEAVYWLRVADQRPRHTPLQAHKTVLAEPKQLDESSLIGLALNCSLPDGDAMAALAVLMPGTDIVDMLAGPPPSGHRSHRSDEPRGDLATGIRQHLLPRLDDADRGRLAHAAGLKLRDRLARDPDHHFGYEAFLAAQLGLHEEIEQVLASWPDGWLGDHLGGPTEVLFGLGSAGRLVDEWERVRAAHMTDRDVAAWLACTGLDHLGAIVASGRRADNRESASQVVRAFAARVHAPEAAPAFLELLRSSRAPAEARAWLDDHPEQAAAGLVGQLARSGQLADDARDHLRRMARGPQRSVLEALAERLPAAEAERLRERVLDDPIAALPELTQRPAWLEDAAGRLGRRALPGWLAVDTLPLLVIEAARLGPDDAAVIVRALRASTLEEPDAAVAALREAADPDEAEAFAWSLFDLWLGEGAPSKDKWAFTAVGLLGGDRSASRLAPMIRAWPGESQHQRAVLGLGVLGAIGTETALMQLDGIAQKVKFKGLKQRAREAIEQIARARGLSKAQLEDRIVPTAGLDDDGRRTFDYGPRQFEFVLGPGLKPMVRDAGGKLRTSPPAPGARDDADLAARAREDWKLLRKTIADVVKIQAGRLEQAMVSQRRWPIEEFDRFVVRHPLQRHLARLLIFGAWAPDGGLRSFRLTEEGDLAGADDESFALAADDRVGVVHPLQLSESERASWGELQADYELVPPFPQLARTVRDVEPAELRERELKRFARLKVPAITLVGILDRGGWTRGEPADGGLFTHHHKRFEHVGLTAVAAYDGIPIGYMLDWDAQAIETCFVVRGGVDVWYASEAVNRAIPWGDVDPIVRSEVLGTLNAIAAKAAE